ncbi:AI-2E family transporter [Rathayibacter toxicus]|uniref:AI-2E family transporter n=1 Tax=Rathayibacter toxicus TaxID=145458 RepID=A0A0U1PVZ3_9MICO|nr:AI-2E family transporter [Rathayibacter toxicus]ALS57846.1 permease [Rathayibacter toxicus]KKM46957.1 permease [Rathayibacter toxicus]PPG20483.1 AI-2E family transporter [Rathayibacter toxicus]PPG45585.1 AI-2E family transporter [Rathayibacter toxicus]PPH22685.1 AI-2E family transporter [Rathayibacter toxicus]
MRFGRPRRTVGPRIADQPAPRPEVALSIPDSALVSDGMRIAGAWSWRILVVVAALAVLVVVIVELRLIVIPLCVAIILAALLVPFSSFLQHHRWPKWLAILVSELGIVVIIGGLLFLVVTQVFAGFDDLNQRTVQSYDALTIWLRESPLQLTASDIDHYAQQALVALQQDAGSLVSGALSIGSTVGHVLTGVLLTLFSTLFILIDGPTIWRWVVGLFPQRARGAVDGAGRAGWVTLTSFVRVQIFVAFVDAVGIGLGAFLLGVPLALPLSGLVFLGSFVPVIGAVVTGALAVFVALVYNGPLIALVLLIVVLAVQQLEGHVLQPLVMGSAVKVHPLAVVLAVAGGSILAGIAGAFFAVPFIAALNVMVTYIASGAWRSPLHTPQKVAAENAD